MQVRLDCWSSTDWGKQRFDSRGHTQGCVHTHHCPGQKQYSDSQTPGPEDLPIGLKRSPWRAGGGGTVAPSGDIKAGGRHMGTYMACSWKADILHPWCRDLTHPTAYTFQSWDTSGHTNNRWEHRFTRQQTRGLKFPEPTLSLDMPLDMAFPPEGQDPVPPTRG